MSLGQNTGVGSLSFPQGISPTQELNQVSHIAGEFFTSWATREAPSLSNMLLIQLSAALFTVCPHALLALLGLPDGTRGKEPACQLRRRKSRRFRTLAEKLPLQCSCLENPVDGGAWWAAVYRAAQSQTQLK